MAKADDEVLAMLPWMVRDWLSSKARAVLKHEQRSVYRELMDHAWLSPGCVLPDNDAVLAALADIDLDSWKALRPLLLSLECFEVRGATLINTKLHALWIKARKLRAEKQRLAKKAGQASAKARGYGQPRTFNGRSTDVQRMINRPGEQTLNPPSPSPSPSHNNGLNGPAKNPLVTDRPALELECLRLVREVCEATKRFPEDVLAAASEHKGKSKLDPAAMTDTRLLHTVRTLRAELERARAPTQEHGRSKMPWEKVAEQAQREGQSPGERDPK